MSNKDLYMKTVTYKQLQSSIILVLALGLLTACGSGSTDKGEGDALQAGDYTQITGETLASIEEASGICYSKNRDSLFVVSDKGILYELDMTGVEKRTPKTFKTEQDKKYDYEGVACDDTNNRVAVAVEGKDNVHTIDYETLTIQTTTILGEVKPTGDIQRPANDTLFKDKDGKKGIEGITLHNGTVYISNQSDIAYPGQDSSFVFTLDDYSAAAPTIQRDIDHGHKDISGLAFYHDSFYMVSGINRSLIKYDINSNTTLFKKNLPIGISAEGVAFDDAGNIYFADDKGGKIYKYKASDFGIE